MFYTRVEIAIINLICVATGEGSFRRWLFGPLSKRNSLRISSCRRPFVEPRAFFSGISMGTAHTQASCCFACPSCALNDRANMYSVLVYQALRSPVRNRKFKHSRTYRASSLLSPSHAHFRDFEYVGQTMGISK